MLSSLMVDAMLKSGRASGLPASVDQLANARVTRSIDPSLAASSVSTEGAGGGGRERPFGR